MIESYFFAIFYKEKVYFRRFIDSKLFTNNLSFSEDYFSFFWGNMDRASVSAGRASLVGTLVGTLYKLGRDHEKVWLREQTKLEMGRHTGYATKKFATAHESLEFQKELENHIIQRDLPILSAEKKIKSASHSIVDYING